MSETIVKRRRRNFALLNREVIKPGYCVSCGGCEAVCPVYVISMEQLVPKLVGGCISCGACVDICLRYKQRDEQPEYDENSIGTIKEVYIGRSKIEEISSRSKNGGVVTIRDIVNLATDLNVIEAILFDGGTSVDYEFDNGEFSVGFNSLSNFSKFLIGIDSPSSYIYLD